jgi:hypothetical protein
MVRATVTAALFVALALLSGEALAQEQDFQKILEKYGTPGPEHKYMEQLVGTWKVKAKFWLQPGAEPMVSEGMATRKWTLGKRYLAEGYKGSAAGQPFEGAGFMGFDRAQKKFISVWADTMGTGIEMSSGTYDPKKKIFTFTSEPFDPFVGKKVKNKETVRIVSKDEHIAEISRVMPDGSDFKTLELHFTRTEGKKKAK